MVNFCIIVVSITKGGGAILPPFFDILFPVSLSIEWFFYFRENFSELTPLVI